MIKTIDQLKLKLLNYTDTERLDRHANLEIAFAEGVDQVKMLTHALKQSQLENADLRYQIKSYDKLFNYEQDECDRKAEAEYQSYLRDKDEEERG